jgi:hypothetical protein
VPTSAFSRAAAGNITENFYRYRFGAGLQASENELPLGSFHGIELPYAFNYSEILNSTEQVTSDLLVGLFTSLARNDTPPTTTNDSAAAWPVYSLASPEVLQIEDNGVAFVLDESNLRFYDEDVYQLLEEILGLDAASPTASPETNGTAPVRRDRLAERSDLDVLSMVEKVRGTIASPKVKRSQNRKLWQI